MTTRYRRRAHDVEVEQLTNGNYLVTEADGRRAVWHADDFRDEFEPAVPAPAYFCGSCRSELVYDGTQLVCGRGCPGGI